MPKAPPPEPAPVSLKHVEWSVAVDADKNANFCVSSIDYQSLSINSLLILHWMDGARAVMDFYKADRK